MAETKRERDEVVVGGVLDPELAELPDGPLPARTPAEKVEPPRRRSPKPQAPTLAMLLEHDVEVRCFAGGIYRGRLIALSPENLLIERKTGKLALLRREGVVGVCDEGFPVGG